MNYNKIENIRKQKKVSQRDLCKIIGITTVGYSKMIREESIKVSTLEKIAKVLEVPVIYFFTDDVTPTNQVAEPSTPYGTNKLLEEILNELKEQLKQKDDQIQFLQHLIEQKLQ